MSHDDGDDDGDDNCSPVRRRSPADMESESDVRISFRHCFVFVLGSRCSAAFHLRKKGSLFR